MPFMAGGYTVARVAAVPPDAMGLQPTQMVVSGIEIYVRVHDCGDEGNAARA
ncbi:hypothetical protein BX600DRAFT_450994 [Xylariales sp. PMI_506]|nr:hypothetical protein BX600DRAFT_450994 [Xylariales sp. PMI_506]